MIGLGQARGSVQTRGLGQARGRCPYSYNCRLWVKFSCCKFSVDALYVGAGLVRNY
jgi:hypothetical protein